MTTSKYGTRLSSLFVCVVLVFAGCTRQDATNVTGGSSIEASLVDGISFRNLGPGNRELELISATLFDPDAGRNARIIQTTAQEKEGIAALFSPSTGATEYILMPGADGARAVSVIDGEVFIGTYLDGQIFRWKPGMEKPIQIPLPKQGDERMEFVFSVEKASDGNVYIGTWPEGALLRMDPATNNIVNLGPLTDDPPREYYLRHINAQFDGRLFLSFGTEVSLKEYNLATGAVREFLPEKYRDRSWVSHTVRFRDMLVAYVESPATLLFLDADSGELLRAKEVTQGRVWPHNRTSIIAHNDLLYFGTIEDDGLHSYNFDTDKFTFIDHMGHPIGVTGDGHLFTRTRLGHFSVFDLNSGEYSVRRQAHFHGSGMLVHAMAEGPGNTVVGGTYINQGYFAYSPDSSMYSPGRSVEFPGQIDALVTHDEKIFVGHYTKARFSVYDPKRSWNPGPDTNNNPQIIGTAGELQDRVPHGTVGPDGNLYFATKPAYGKLGGAIVMLNPQSNELTTFRDVVQDQSIYALVSDDERYLWGSTSVRGGLGSRPSARSSRLFVWDTANQNKTKEFTPVEGAYEIWGLDWLDERFLVGAADSVMFIFDTVDETVETSQTIAPEEIKKLVTSVDGWVYGMTEERFFRVSADLETVQLIDMHEGYWDSLVETNEGRMFVGRGPHVLEVIRDQVN